MSLNNELRKEGIEVVEKLNTLTVNSIATNIAQKLVNTLPDQNINYHELFMKLSRLTMYIAKLPNNSAAKYFYKNSSIYFSEKADLENLSDVIIHECIHAIQANINNKNKLIKLGLCDFKDIKLSGMALNEAAVQLLTMKCCNSKFDTVKYFDIEFSTNSPDYYALECNLVRQMAYITGEYVLYNSTLYGNDDFKNKFIALTSEEDYEIIKNNINSIMYLEDKLHFILEKVQHSEIVTPEIARLMKKSAKIKANIKRGFLVTQNRIFTSFFDNLFDSLYSPKSFENFRNALYTYRNFIGVSDDYTFFNDYYITKMANLEDKYNNVSNTPLALVPIKKETLFEIIIRKIRTLTHLNTNKGYNYDSINMK